MLQKVDTPSSHDYEIITLSKWQRFAVGLFMFSIAFTMFCMTVYQEGFVKEAMIFLLFTGVITVITVAAMVYQYMMGPFLLAFNSLGICFSTRLKNKEYYLLPWNIVKDVQLRRFRDDNNDLRFSVSFSVPSRKINNWPRINNGGVAHRYRNLQVDKRTWFLNFRVRDENELERIQEVYDQWKVVNGR